MGRGLFYARTISKSGQVPAITRKRARDRPLSFRECRAAPPLSLLVSKEDAQAFSGWRAALPHASEGDRGSFAGVLPLVWLAIGVHGLDQQAPAAILAHVRHDGKPTPKRKDIARVDPMEGNESVHARQVRSEGLPGQA